MQKYHRPAAEDSKPLEGCYTFETDILSRVRNKELIDCTAACHHQNQNSRKRGVSSDTSRSITQETPLLHSLLPPFLYTHQTPSFLLLQPLHNSLFTSHTDALAYPHRSSFPPVPTFLLSESPPHSSPPAPASSLTRNLFPCKSPLEYTLCHASASPHTLPPKPALTSLLPAHVYACLCSKKNEGDNK